MLGDGRREGGEEDVHIYQLSMTELNSQVDVSSLVSGCVGAVGDGTQEHPPTQPDMLARLDCRIQSSVPARGIDAEQYPRWWFVVWYTGYLVSSLALEVFMCLYPKVPVKR
jgi:hypothetical protein